MFNLLLTLAALWLLSASPVFVPCARAQEALPVTAVEGEALTPPDAPLVIELFSSQACVFCPAADKLFAGLIRQDNIIGLSCHVDYFDVKQGSLAQPFCTERQSWYMDRLHAGPNYTPQMVIQGSIDAVGYKESDVEKAMKDGQRLGVARLTITPGTEPGSYSVSVPEGFNGTGSLYLILTDKPHDLTVAEGRNRDQKMIYYNIVSAFSDLGPWPAGQTRATIRAEMSAGQKGFAVILQDPASAKILAAGKFGG